ncbi:uncharacterized protein LOC106876741 [Octopus bimaculoides]|uniref:uncharacterized protein LOC106876741 n=1 Tax=Octopus bimaculoides TaxID=37653 RepID=UPI00071C81CA|nr:uncharacterized protein LOC106876741 [Octopus bimaculoides]|eukprot:XP_014780916.1 PREDICTED: uncharacterized protein LOC106876741 [Octopus bimaculoides]
MCLLQQLPTQERIYASIDSITDPTQVMVYPTEFLNSQELLGMPPHKLCLRLGGLIILLRNLEPPRLCNGTRLVVTQLLDDVIEAKIITGQGVGDIVFISRIPLIPIDCVFPMKRVQFPVRLSFVMTINKAQGQSLKVVGLDLSTPCFSHRQLYVGCSRAGNSANLFYYAPRGLTTNVIYKAALQ